MIRERSIEGTTWYVVTRRFPDAATARAAWHRLQAEDALRGNSLQLGVYRHGPDQAGAEASYVTAVTHDRPGAEVADRMLAAPDSGLDDDIVDALIWRRIEVLATQHETGTRTILIRRPEDRGAKVWPGGRFEEQIGGDE